MLTTAHVHDKRPEAASLMNLAALCQRCHNRHDATDRQRNRRLNTGQMPLCYAALSLLSVLNTA